MQPRELPRPAHRAFVPALVLALGLAAGVAFAAPKVGSTITIRVLSTKVMKAPKFIGASASTASRGDQVTVAEVKGDWYRVTGKHSGWIHKTNVTERAVELSAKPGGDGTGGASKDEVELAGRGFTPQVEQKYKDQNPTLVFAHIDAIEAMHFDLESLGSFVDEGGLGGGE